MNMLLLIIGKPPVRRTKLELYVNDPTGRLQIWFMILAQTDGPNGIGGHQHGPSGLPLLTFLVAVWDIPWWRHQMETFSALLAVCAGIHRSPVNSPHKGQWRGALMFSLVCAWINGWGNNREADDLRRHCAHYDVTVIWMLIKMREFGGNSQLCTKQRKDPNRIDKKSSLV